MDAISKKRIELLHPKIREEVLRLVDQANAQLTGDAQIRIVQGLRTFPEQDQLYAQGRTAPGKKVTKAKGGQSYHNYGLAIDFCLVIKGTEISWDTAKDYDGDHQADWLEVIQVFLKAGGWTWGKAFNDLPHLEKTFGYGYRDLLKKYNAKDFISGSNYVSL